jgi:hypothetical protein
MIIKHMETPEVLIAALRAIRVSAKMCRKNREILGREAIRTALLALGKHKNNGDVQLEGFGALAAMAEDVESNAECLTEAGVLRGMLRQLDIHMKNAHMQLYACLIFTFVSESCAHKIPALVEAGCSAHISRAMRQHEGDSERDPACLNVVRRGCMAIVSFIDKYHQHSNSRGDNETLSMVFARIIQDGGVESIMSCTPRLLERHSETVWTAFTFVHILHAECPELVTDCGPRLIRHIVTCLLHCLNYHRITKESAQILIIVSSLLAKVIMCAFSVPTWSEFQDEFGLCGGVKAVSGCLKLCLNGPGCEELQRVMQVYNQRDFHPGELPNTALFAIFKAAFNHAANQNLCDKEAGLRDTILSLIAMHQWNVKEIAEHFLRSIMKGADTIQACKNELRGKLTTMHRRQSKRKYTRLRALLTHMEVQCLSRFYMHQRMLVVKMPPQHFLSSM